MKNIKSLIIAGIVTAGSIVGVTPSAKAITRCDTNRYGAEVCVETVGYDSLNVVVNDKYDNTGYIMFVDCSSKQFRTRSVDGYSYAMMQKEAYKACQVIGM